MPATKALGIETRIMPVVMHSIAPIMSYLRDKTIDQGDVLSGAIEALGKAMPPEAMADLIKTLCSDEGVNINGQRVNFERDFSGGDGVFFKYQIAAFVLEANFADFISALLASGVLGLTLKSENPEESIGESGGPVSPIQPYAA